MCFILILQTFLDGQQPLLPNQAKLLITSDCDSSNTDVIPNISWEGGALAINVNPEEDASTMSFLEPSSYSAFWSYVSGFCGGFPFSSSTAVPGPDSNDDGFVFVDSIPTLAAESTSSTILGTLWPSGDKLSDYTDCGFNCCTNEDCDQMLDFQDQIIGGCCIEGACQVKETFDERCYDVIGPPADVVCGYDAWLNYQGDGNCGPVLPTTTIANLGLASSTSATTTEDVSTTTTFTTTTPTTTEAEAETSSTIPSTTSQETTPTTAEAETSTTTTSSSTTQEATPTTAAMETSSTTTSSTTEMMKASTTAAMETSSTTNTPTTETKTTSTTIAMDTTSTADTATTTESATSTTSTSNNNNQNTETSSTEISATTTSNSEPNVSAEPPSSPSILPIEIDSKDTSSPSPTTVDNSTDKPTFNFNVDLPSRTPSKSNTPPPTAKPTFWWESQTQEARIQNAAPRRMSSLSYQIMVTTFVAVFLISAIFSGREGAANAGNIQNYLWGFGKFTVAAVAASSIFTNPSNGNIRKSGKYVQHSFPAKSRALATCTYNVEILIDGCSHALDIDAPSARVIDVAIEDLTAEQSENDPCVTEYTANLAFPFVEGDSIIVDLPDNGAVQTLPEYDCLRAIEGRPFVDISGHSLQASPFVVSAIESVTVSWLEDLFSADNDKPAETQSTIITNTTIKNQYLLGEEWVQRALGEHSSVASFSAFSISLMTNQAPSTLVEDALNAGLDEVRHARTSFEIASKLLGRNVGPGPLPQSSHYFKHDLSSLAMSVAKEGCVDESLSAFVAVAEIELINNVLEKGTEGTKYSSIHVATLIWIRDKLLTIATEESNHSALAWRTLNWVCSVDANVCKAVEQHVFNENSLKTAIRHRFSGLANGKPAILETMRISWENIHHAHKDIINSDIGKNELPELSCANNGDHDAHPLLSSLIENILLNMN